MAERIRNYRVDEPVEARSDRMGNRMSVEEIARRLDVGRQAVYEMLEQGILPGIRLGRRWIITRHAYEQWERTCGTHPALLTPRAEVMVLN